MKIPTFNNIILIFPDDVWKIHRKSLNYSFNLKILQSFIPIFVENTKSIIDQMMIHAYKNEEFNLLSYTTKCAVSMICGECQCSLWKLIFFVWNFLRLHFGVCHEWLENSFVVFAIFQLQPQIKTENSLKLTDESEPKPLLIFFCDKILFNRPTHFQINR